MGMAARRRAGVPSAHDAAGAAPSMFPGVGGLPHVDQGLTEVFERAGDGGRPERPCKFVRSVPGRVVQVGEGGAHGREEGVTQETQRLRADHSRFAAALHGPLNGG